MATHGESINQTAPTVAVVGSISGSLTVQGADTPFDIDTGVDTSTVTKVDTGRTIKSDESLVTIHGDCTVTITAASGTTVHYTINGKAPSSKACQRTLATEKFHSQTTYKYTAPFTIPIGRPSKYNNVVLRVRAYKTDSNGQNGVSPNEKSKLMLVKFNIKAS